MAPKNGQSGQTNDPNSPWYIHPHHTVDSSQQLQQQADQQAQQDVNNSLGNVPVVNTFDPLVSGVVGQQNYQSALGNQANELRQGVDTRHSPTIAPTNYLSFSHPQLHTMVTQQVDPGQAGHIGSSWTSIGNTMVRFQDDVAGAISNSETQWQGTAGDSARTFMAQMANWIGTAGQGAQLAGTQAARQSDAVANAKAMMPEPVNFDWNTAMNQLKASNPDPLSYLTQYSADAGMYAAQQGAHFAAAQVVRHDAQTLGQSNVMPAFSRPPVFGTGNTTGQPPKPNPIQPRP